MIAATIANLTHGGNRKSDQEVNRPFDPVSAPKAAKMMSVGVATVVRAKKVQKKGAPAGWKLPD